MQHYLRLQYVLYVSYVIKNETENEGISLQPYVPTGMAYDSYKQNQSYRLDNKLLLIYPCTFLHIIIGYYIGSRKEEREGCK